MSPLTVAPQGFVDEPCSGDEERLQIKLWVICGLHAVVFHLHVAVKPPARVDAAAARRGVQHVSHAQGRQRGRVSGHRSADSDADRCMDTEAALGGAGWFSLPTRLPRKGWARLD